MLKLGKRKAEKAITTDMDVETVMTDIETKQLDPISAALAETAAKKEKKIKKKKKRKRIVIAGIAVIVLGAIIVPQIFAKDAYPMVTTEAAKAGDIEEVLDTSGKVESDYTKTYFAAIGAKIAESKVKVGEAVKEGDVLVSYDVSSLETEAKKAELTESASINGYQEKLNKNNEDETTLADATVQASGYQYLVDQKEAEVRYINEQISKTQLCVTKMTRTPDTTKTQEELDKEYNGYQTDLTNYQIKLAIVQDELADLKEKLSTYKSDKESTEKSVLSDNSKAEIAAQSELAKITANETMSNLDIAKAGIASEFNGIVTEVKAVEGETVQKGAGLFTIASSDEVSVKVELSKYDLEKVKEGQSATVTLAGKEYEGVVSRINRIAEKNAAGNPVVSAMIQIQNADSDVFLGVEAKVTINIANAKGVVLIPVQAVNTGKDGEFCYVVEDSIVVKKMIKTGVTSTEYVEITEGISEGDQIITTISEAVIEGAMVTAMPTEE